MNWRSTSWRNSEVFRSYQPPVSIHCLRSSIGGCAPNTSLAGMLRSSTKMRHLLPSGGPKVPFLRLSSFPSMTSWVWFAWVCALKAKEMFTYRSFSNLLSSSWAITVVFPVPVGPEIRMWRSALMSVCSRNAFRVVSAVGTMMVCTCASLGMSKNAIFFVQSSNFPDWPL